ncbi:hypothetical protein I7I50_03403 [Histoplasma capsulatum G186AR]|uniref:Uncharacterized protein n=1 Tax=Ajellomyces capsulatus TaxID=5037 RepID=A0A8H8CX98_AJECA|nr:hypothetical protein I7I52_04310 [Histoplasma capsulatum]QSS74555.1 hypothetical protein I7I50_03403 [Histoplasma capsulatum G186AR]
MLCGSSSLSTMARGTTTDRHIQISGSSSVSSKCQPPWISARFHIRSHGRPLSGVVPVRRSDHRLVTGLHRSVQTLASCQTPRFPNDGIAIWKSEFGSRLVYFRTSVRMHSFTYI